MSYEGREQHICENGHLMEIPCLYQWNEAKTKCYHCKADSVWVNHIDDTNGHSVGEISQEEFNRLLIAPDKFETCNLGHEHLVVPAVYKIPSKDYVFIKREEPDYIPYTGE